MCPSQWDTTGRRCQHLCMIPPRSKSRLGFPCTLSEKEKRPSFHGASASHSRPRRQPALSLSRRGTPLVRSEGLSHVLKVPGLGGATKQGCKPQPAGLQTPHALHPVYPMQGTAGCEERCRGVSTTPNSAAPGQRPGEEFMAMLEAEIGKQERKAVLGHRVHVEERWEIQLEGKVEARWCRTFTATSNISKLGIHAGGNGSQ